MSAPKTSPILIKAGDNRVILNGQPPLIDCRVVAEDLWQSRETEIATLKAKLLAIDNPFLSPVLSERTEQERRLKAITGHWPHAAPAWQYLNTLLSAAERNIELQAQIEAMFTWGEVKSMLMMDSPWNLLEVLKALSKAACHLLDDHGCDNHGHEEVREAEAQAVLAIERIETLLRRCLLRSPQNK